jgi:uncharacterized protein (TIGR04255 family)
VEKKVFPHNFLNEVILQVNFNNPVRLTSEMIRTFHESLPFKKKEYQERDIKGVEIKFEKDNESLNMTRIGKSGIFQINDYDHTVKFILDHEKFLFSTSKYEHFSLFFEDFKKGFQAFQGTNKVTEYKRLGLRYINIISLAEEEIKNISDWREFIKSAYIPDYPGVNILETELTLRRNMNRFVLGDGEVFMNINLGLWNNSFPGKITDREFVLDIDCYIDNKILSENDILEMTSGMNEKAFKCFISMTTERLQGRMEKE